MDIHIDEQDRSEPQGDRNDRSSLVVRVQRPQDTLNYRIHGLPSIASVPRPFPIYSDTELGSPEILAGTGTEGDRSRLFTQPIAIAGQGYLTLSAPLNTPQHLSVTGEVRVTGDVIVDGAITMRDMDKQLQAQEETIRTLQATVCAQAEMLNKLWNAPGMPGYVEAQSEFDSLVYGVDG